MLGTSDCLAYETHSRGKVRETHAAGERARRRGRRIPMLDVDEARARALDAGVPEGMADLNVFRILLHDPPTAAALNGLLHRLLWKGSLDQRLRELVILRIGWVSGAVYEWTQHWHVAVALGIDEADLVAVRDWEAYEGFGPVERAILAATDETLERGAIGDATWVACAEHLDEALGALLGTPIGHLGPLDGQVLVAVQVVFAPQE